MTMSAAATESMLYSPTGEITTALIPTVTRIDTRLDVSPISVILAVSIVCILSPITVTGNSIILVAFYKYKRLRTASNCLLVSLAVSDFGSLITISGNFNILVVVCKYKRLRTASNCLLVSLAVSDFGVGVFMPFGMQLELSGLPENGVSTVCIVPYCIVIALCSVSVLVTVAIAVDRLTSLAQPLRYKNIITHSSIEKYIAVFWIYAIAVGLSPLIYAKIVGEAQSHSGSCRFGAAVLPPVRVFLVVAVWAPSALVLLGCYMYVYLVARAHARAIYTVELSFRHETQTLALPRYGQTLAVTVGAFLVLWLPFQTCMLVDIFYGTDILSEWAVVWLGLPILAHSGANPWIYAFHHGEMRVAAGKIVEDFMALFGVMPSRYGCSPTRRGSNTNLELAEVNNENENVGGRRPPENCFAAKQTGNLYASRRCLEISGKQIDVSPEKNDTDATTSSSTKKNDIIEENIHDLTKMLDPKYIIDRNHMIDSNHNIDKIKNLKYLLDPTFNKIRHLRRINHKRLTAKHFPRFPESKFISYQNLKSDGAPNRRFLQLNALSDPMLNANSPLVDAKDFDDALCRNPGVRSRRNSNLSSMSDPNIKSAINTASDGNLRLFPPSKNAVETHGCSVQNLDHDRAPGSLFRHIARYRQAETGRRTQVYPRPRPRFATNFERPGSNVDLRFGDSRASLSTPENSASNPWNASKQPVLTRNITITSNKLANLIPFGGNSSSRNVAPRIEPPPRLLPQPRRHLDILRHSESTNAFDPMAYAKPTDSYRLMETLTVPIVHSEPPSPIDPLPLAALQEEEVNNSAPTGIFAIHSMANDAKFLARDARSPVRHSDPIVSSVLLNIEDCSEAEHPVEDCVEKNSLDLIPNDCISRIEPVELFEALLRSSERSREARLSEQIFAEHDSTRFSSRRPSDSKWSESSRSQEVLSNVTEFQAFPSSYSVNDFQACNSGSDLNDLTSLDPFMCPDTLTSSLRESFFEAPSAEDSDIFTSFEENELSPDHVATNVCGSASNMNSKRSMIRDDLQSKSSESVFRVKYPTTKSCTILRLEPSLYRSRPKVRPCKDHILKNSPSKTGVRLAPLAIPTPTDICTPTFDIVSEIKNDSGVGVKV